VIYATVYEHFCGCLPTLPSCKKLMLTFLTLYFTFKALHNQSVHCHNVSVLCDFVLTA